LNGAFSLAVSSDGKFLYLSSGRFTGSDAITIFKRKNDGKLELVDELINFTDKLQRFVGGNEITISSDGKQVYSVASRSDSLVVLDRDQQTGKLKQTQFLVDQYRGVGAMLMPGGLTLSPDDKFVYVASEGSNAITIFQKSTPKPAIAEKPKR
ncbi:MAG: beta-propeller fold lactonase family protein, partial [Planctomycetaceae bacterium]|nr:beta-propeller fold lactonase family protein [Planctomycetaceae bacterium]